MASEEFQEWKTILMGLPDSIVDDSVLDMVLERVDDPASGAELSPWIAAQVLFRLTGRHKVRLADTADAYFILLSSRSCQWQMYYPFWGTHYVQSRVTHYKEFRIPSSCIRYIPCLKSRDT